MRTSRAEQSALWDGGKQAGSATRLPARLYFGPALEAGREYAWQVRVWDEKDHPSAWSKPAHWRQEPVWKARWIAAEHEDAAADNRPMPLLRKTVEVDGKVQARPALRLRSRSIRVSNQWDKSWRQRTGAGLERLSENCFLRHLRCDSLVAEWCECARHSSRKRHVPRAQDSTEVHEIQRQFWTAEVHRPARSRTERGQDTHFSQRRNMEVASGANHFLKYVWR